jgi:hypothetical protein
MPPSAKPPFPWRGVFLLAIAFALIGLAVLLRSHDAAAASTHWLPTAAEWKPLLVVFLVGAFVVLAAFLGSWFGYLRVAFRLRKFSKTHDHTAATRKT